MLKRTLFAFFAISILFVAGGCNRSKTEKIRDISYTVVKTEDIPQELLTQIQEKKEARFKLTYDDGEYLYIASGYGQQETGGYSITVKELYLAENAIYFLTELYGPQKGDSLHEAPSYPYIVVKTESIDKSVVFK